MSKIFVTGGTGYIGSTLIQEAQKENREIIVLTRSKEKAIQLRNQGIQTVVGDLLEDGPWKEVIASCEYVIHLAAPPTWGKKVTKKVATEYSKGHYDMTIALLENINPKVTKNIVYVAGTSYLGDSGDHVARIESYRSAPKGWGPYIAPSVNVLDKYLKRGLPITTVFPAQIYGADSWTVQLYMQPIYNKKSVYSLKGYHPMYSPIHVEDCARACMFLTEHGKTGEEYILTDSEPMRAEQFMHIIEQELGVKSKTVFIPAWLCKLVIGPVLTEYATAHTYFSNQKLLAAGFQYRYQSAHEGLPQVVKTWLATQGKK